MKTVKVIIGGGLSWNYGSLIERTAATGILGVKITQNGEDMGKHLWDEECRRNIYSASKSFTSAAVGIAVKEGLLRLEERLVDAFSEDIPENPNEFLQQATVRDLLTMCLGQQNAELMGGQRPFYQQKDWVRMSLAFPFTECPGKRFLYNNVGAISCRNTCTEAGGLRSGVLFDPAAF